MDTISPKSSTGCLSSMMPVVVYNGIGIHAYHIHISVIFLICIQIRVGKKTKAGYGLRMARVILRKYPIPNGKFDTIVQEKEANGKFDTRMQEEEEWDIMFACNETVVRFKSVRKKEK